MAISADEYEHIVDDELRSIYYPIDEKDDYWIEVDHWKEAQAHLAELIRDEIDRMILEELFKEVEEQKAIVDDILLENLFEV